MPIYGWALDHTNHPLFPQIMPDPGRTEEGVHSLEV